MNILIADILPEENIEQIKAMGHAVTYNPDLGADDLAANVKGVNVLVVRSTKVLSEVVDAADSLSLVIRAGSGVNTIDIDACSGEGIFVSNCPGLNSIAVAELALAHILSLDRNVPDCVADLRSGKWNKGKYSKLSRGLKGRTLGLIGFGNIGQAVARRALAFEMRVMVLDPIVSPSFVERNNCDYAENLEELCARSDVISIHVPLNKNTEKLLDSKAFAAMKPGTFVINTSRGGIIDEKAFMQAAEEKGIRGGFDVFVDEPGSKACDYESDLSQSDHVYGTHHIGASTIQAQLAVAEEVVDLLKDYTDGGHIRNCVNMETASRATAALVIRHYDRVGVLAEIFRILKEEGINVEDMQNIILSGQETACARIKISKPLSDIGKITEDEAIKDAIIHVDMFDL